MRKTLPSPAPRRVAVTFNSFKDLRIASTYYSHHHPSSMPFAIFVKPSFVLLPVSVTNQSATTKTQSLSNRYLIHELLRRSWQASTLANISINLINQSISVVSPHESPHRISPIPFLSSDSHSPS
eukprot:GHVT01105421.1.p1 GENE.GHVT01105421.1~~GHVT01105421.1.p1  ORF type:complete len:125 (-),score=2.53 GHVT01105421.1:367-741(-)